MGSCRAASHAAIACMLLAIAPGAPAMQDVGDVEGVESKVAAARLDAIRRVSLLIGSDVRGAGGEVGVARIRDLVLDEHGRARYFILTPGTQEDDTTLIPVPTTAVTLARLEEADWFALLGIDGTMLLAAPTVGPKGLDALLDPARRAMIDAFFRPVDAPDPVRPGDEPMSSLIRASDVVGATVLGPGNPEGEAVARVDELLIDDDFHARYAVLRVEDGAGRQVPVPLPTLEVCPGEPVVTRIAMDREQLGSAPELEGDWLRLLNGSFIEAINTVHPPSEAAEVP